MDGGEVQVRCMYSNKVLRLYLPQMAERHCGLAQMLVGYTGLVWTVTRCCGLPWPCADADEKVVWSQTNGRHSILAPMVTRHRSPCVDGYEVHPPYGDGTTVLWPCAGGSVALQLYADVDNVQRLRCYCGLTLLAVRHYALM